MDRTERPNNSRQHRLVTVRGAGGSTRQIEARAIPSALTVRADGEEPGFEGYASTFWDVDSYGTAVAPSAFTKTLKDRRAAPLVLWQHNTDWPIGHSLSHEQDGIGLAVRAKVIDTTYGVDAMKLLRGGTPLGLSIGFQTIRERPATSQDPLKFTEETPSWATGNPDWIWVIEEIRLWEYSPVSFPADPNARPTVVHDAIDGLLAAALLEELRTGRLNAADRALAAEIAAAYAAAAPEQLTLPPRTAEEARKDREYALMTLAAARGLTLEQLTCAA